MMTTAGVDYYATNMSLFESLSGLDIKVLIQIPFDIASSSTN